MRGAEIVTCPTCAAPRRVEFDPLEGTSHFASAEGTHMALADALDIYHARNLLEALRIAPDTGDWHGSLRIACQMVIDRDGERLPHPNIRAEDQAEAAAERVAALHGERG